MSDSTDPTSSSLRSQRSRLRTLARIFSSASLRSRAWWVAGVYALFATLWILFSDHALRTLISNPELLLQVSVYKGLGFVAVTSLLLLFMVRWAFGEIEDGYKSLKAHEIEIERLKRLYAALSQINQAIVWTPQRDELFKKICSVLTKHGGFRMAWIGWHDPHTRLLVPVAESGDENGYLQSIQVHTDDRPEGHGPSGTAFREERPYISNDLLRDPTTRPWQTEARRRGFHASAAFPIRVKSEVCGTLNVYAHEIGFFQDKEVALLEEAAVDISFALENLAREEERQQAELALQKSEQRHRSTLDNILESCQLLDFDWRYLYLNHAASIQNRRSNAELLGNRMQDVWPRIEQSRVFALIRCCMEEKRPFHEETEFVFPDGQKGWFDVRGQSVPEGVCLLSIDITERHEAETALRELNESLELKVIERTTELQAALVRAEAADRLKSAFLATMSHELRTPLNSIIGFTGILLQGLAGALNAEQSKQLGMVRSSARHLLELINDVLDLSKIEAGQLEVRAVRFDLRSSIERVTATVKPMADTKGLTLTAIVSPAVGAMESDQRRVEQILLNLLNNAIKFTDHGSVTLTAELLHGFQPTPESAPQAAVKVCVSDTGIGIKPGDLGALFQPFRQIDNGLTRVHEGTGLGLAICRRLTKLLGGDISAASEFSKGSAFTVILPLQPSA